MSPRTAAAALAAAIAICALPAATAAAGTTAKPSLREFTGTVASVKGKSFVLRRSGRAAVTVKVARKTRVAKGAKPRKGRKLVVSARRVRKAWVARSVRLVPAVAGGGEPGDAGTPEDEPIPFDGEAADPGLDLEDALGDLLPGPDEPEE